jgi:hypothetical protein
VIFQAGNHQPVARLPGVFERFSETRLRLVVQPQLHIAAAQTSQRRYQQPWRIQRAIQRQGFLAEFPRLGMATLLTTHLRLVDGYGCQPGGIVQCFETGSALGEQALCGFDLAQIAQGCGEVIFRVCQQTLIRVW